MSLISLTKFFIWLDSKSKVQSRSETCCLKNKIIFTKEDVDLEKVVSKSEKMITDVQLAMFSNLMGIVLFLLVVLYHFIAANSK